MCREQNLHSVANQCLEAPGGGLFVSSSRWAGGAEQLQSPDPPLVEFRGEYEEIKP